VNVTKLTKNLKNSFSFIPFRVLREKVGMRGLKSILYSPHPNPLLYALWVQWERGFLEVS
jgi:hypothetical protein